MILGEISLRDLADINEYDLMKMIFSSGDYFPGFYRYTLGTQQVGEESLGLNTLIWLYYEQKMAQGLHSREDWIDLQHEIHERDIASDDARNAGNFPEVRTLFSERMMKWYSETKGFDIIYLDTEKLVDSFKENTSYYFMGSMVHYSEGQLHISYNDLTQESALSLHVSFKDVQSYLEETYSIEDFNSLFLYGETVGILKFNSDEYGELQMNESLIDSYLLKNSDTKVFAAPIESRDLPMRYAKSIRLTNFRRGDHGKFEVWRTDQNW